MWKNREQFTCSCLWEKKPKPIHFHIYIQTRKKVKEHAHKCTSKMSSVIEVNQQNKTYKNSCIRIEQFDKWLIIFLASISFSFAVFSYYFLASNFFALFLLIFFKVILKLHIEYGFPNAIISVFILFNQCTRLFRLFLILPTRNEKRILHY